MQKKLLLFLLVSCRCLQAMTMDDQENSKNDLVNLKQTIRSIYTPCSISYSLDGQKLLVGSATMLKLYNQENNAWKCLERKEEENIHTAGFLEDAIVIIKKKEQPSVLSKNFWWSLLKYWQAYGHLMEKVSRQNLALDAIIELNIAIHPVNKNRIALIDEGLKILNHREGDAWEVIHEVDTDVPVAWARYSLDGSLLAASSDQGIIFFDSRDDVYKKFLVLGKDTFVQSPNILFNPVKDEFLAAGASKKDNKGILCFWDIKKIREAMDTEQQV